MTPDTIHKLHAAVVPIIGGALMGWAGNALTLSGRVAAVEQALLRIESRMDQAVQRQAAPAPANTTTTTKDAR